MTTPQTQARVRAVVDEIAVDALSIYETTLREGNASETEFAAAMAAKRERVFRWAAQTAADIIATLDHHDRREIDELKRELAALRVDIRACKEQLDVLEQIAVVDRPRPN